MSAHSLFLLLKSIHVGKIMSTHENNSFTILYNIQAFIMKGFSVSMEN